MLRTATTVVAEPWPGTSAAVRHTACNPAAICACPALQAYFESLGFEIPGHMNPADAYMDIIAGIIKPATGTAVDIAACWQQWQQGQHSSSSTQAAQHSSRMMQGTQQAANDMLGTSGLEGMRLLDGTDESDAAVVAIAASRRVSGQDAPTGKVSQSGNGSQDLQVIAD